MEIIKLNFLVFFTIFFIVYWSKIINSYYKQNILLLIGSYIFYIYIDWRFFTLLIISSYFYYLLGIFVDKKNKLKKIIFITGLIYSVLTLIYFKYTISILEYYIKINNQYTIDENSIYLPLGISFYTFRNLSYLIDIYRDKYKPTKDLIIYFSYISFFPTIIAGPIERPLIIINQLQFLRIFNYTNINYGIKQIIWGLFKKLVIADNCAMYTDSVYNNFEEHKASTLLFVAFLYTIQLYADFSGYSDIAIGVSRLLGINVSPNFNYPFFSQNMAEFWRRWHISLTSWATDYIFNPLNIALRQLNKLGTIIAVILNLTLIGIWHGSNSTFVFFGLIHGVLFIPIIMFGSLNITSNKPYLNEIIKFIKIITTFLQVMVCLIIFRSNSVEDSIKYLNLMVSFEVLNIPEINDSIKHRIFSTIFFIIIMLVIEWKNKEKPFPIIKFGMKENPILHSFLYLIGIFIIFIFSGVNKNFIYSNF